MQKIIKELTKKLLELISKYSNTADNKTNKQKSVTFLYTSNKDMEYEIKTHFTFTFLQNESIHFGEVFIYKYFF